MPVFGASHVKVTVDGFNEATRLVGAKGGEVGEFIETVKIGPYHPDQKPLSMPETFIVA